MDEQKQQENQHRKSTDAWDEVGKQFQALGDSLTAAVRASWNDEANQAQINRVQVKLQSMADDLNAYIKEQTDTPRAQKLSDDLKRVSDSVIDAGEKVVEEVRPHVLDAVRDLTASLHKMVNRVEETPDEPPAKEEPTPPADKPEPQPGQPKDIHE